MNGNIRINPRMVKSVAEKIGDQAATYNKEIEQIYSTIDELRHAWQGSSAERFINDIEQYREEFKRFGAQLNGFSHAFKSIAGDYQRLEDGDI